MPHSEGEILARFEKAREFEATAGNWTFRLRLPTAFAERRMAFEVAGQSNAVASEVWSRSMVVAAVAGWYGPTINDVLNDGDSTPLPCTPALVTALLDDRTDVIDALASAINDQRRVRREAFEAAAKNSASVSAGS